MIPTSRSEPEKNCILCPRLVDYRAKNIAAEPDWWNAPAPSFGDRQARLLVLGLAPGRNGANRTGRVFTGDYAGDLLYETLSRYGFAKGSYRADPADDLSLHDCRISNAVRCAPPLNQPTPLEIRTCAQFLSALIADMPNLRVIVPLGKIAHDSLIRTLGQKLAAAKFGHGAEYIVPGAEKRSIHIVSSYHCSRYNTNTGLLTPAMFHAIFARAQEILVDQQIEMHD